MEYLAFDRDLLNLLKHLRPFLSPAAVAVTELAEDCVELLVSDRGRKTVSSFARLLSKEGTLAVGTSHVNPFLLFLIFLLLLLSFPAGGTARILPAHDQGPRILPGGEQAP